MRMENQRKCHKCGSSKFLKYVVREYALKKEDYDEHTRCLNGGWELASDWKVSPCSSAKDVACKNANATPTQEDDKLPPCGCVTDNATGVTTLRCYPPCTCFVPKNSSGVAKFNSCYNKQRNSGYGVNIVSTLSRPERLSNSDAVKVKLQSLRSELEKAKTICYPCDQRTTVLEAFRDADECELLMPVYYNTGGRSAKVITSTEHWKGNWKPPLVYPPGNREMRKGNKFRTSDGYCYQYKKLSTGKPEKAPWHC